MREPNIAELCRRFLSQHEASRARIELLEHMLRRACDALGGVPCSSLTPEQIAAWRGSMPPATRWQATQALAQVTAWALRWELASVDPFERVPNPGPPRTEFEPFSSWDEIAALSQALAPGVALLPWLGAGCGLRPGELLGLSWDCIGLARGELSVRRTAWRGQLRSTLKTRRSKRIVPLRGRVADQLAAVPAEQRRGLVFAALRRAGIEHPHRIYDLRHTYATWSLRAGVSIFQLARRMGTSVDMIDATYGHLAADAGEHERALLDAGDNQ